MRDVIHPLEFYLIVVLQNRSHCYLLFEYIEGDAEVPENQGPKSFVSCSFLDAVPQRKLMTLITYREESLEIPASTLALSVNLTFEGVDFAKLPQHVQDRLKVKNNYSVQQLLVDFTSMYSDSRLI